MSGRRAGVHRSLRFNVALLVLGVVVAPLLLVAAWLGVERQMESAMRRNAAFTGVDARGARYAAPAAHHSGASGGRGGADREPVSRFIGAAGRRAVARRICLHEPVGGARAGARQRSVGAGVGGVALQSELRRLDAPPAQLFALGVVCVVMMALALLQLITLATPVLTLPMVFGAGIDGVLR